MTQFREGIYLKVTKGKIGTGNTASSMIYKNYYAVRHLDGELELYLLDNDFKPLGLRETAKPSSFAASYEYQPSMQAHYEEAVGSLPGRTPAKAATGAKSAPAPAAARPAAAGPAQARQPEPAAAAEDKPWWER